MKASREELRQFIKDYLSNKKCARCPENHIACLDFHHKDPSTKDFKIAEAATKRYSKTKILREIEKCEILCANCHRKEHN